MQDGEGFAPRADQARCAPSRKGSGARNVIVLNECSRGATDASAALATSGLAVAPNPDFFEQLDANGPIPLGGRRAKTWPNFRPPAPAFGCGR